jgi:hypothetical protein
LIRQEQNSQEVTLNFWFQFSKSAMHNKLFRCFDLIWQEHDVQQNKSKHKNISLGAIHQ